MCKTRWITWSLCCVMFGLGCEESSKNDGNAGRGGSNASGGHSGATSQDAGMDSGEPDHRDAGTAGSGGAGGASGTGGTGGAAGSGKGGQGAEDEDSGLPEAGAGGASGSGGAGGAADSGDAAYDQCLSDATSAGQTVDGCTQCLCQADKCQAELNVATHDAKANTAVICSVKKQCTDLCCLCGDTACDFSNYATGPCAAEVESAAGVTPGKGVFTNGSTVSSKCALDSKDDNSCRRVALLSQCERNKCADACPVAKTCQ